MKRSSHLPQTSVRRPRLTPAPKLNPRPTLSAPARRRPPVATIGNQAAWDSFRAWLAAPAGALAVLAGPCGTGKTHGARALAQERGFVVFEVDVCDASKAPRAVVDDLRAARRAAMSVDREGAPANQGRPLVLLDDVDAYPSPVADAVLAVLARHEPGLAPVVCTCGADTPLLRQLRAAASLVVRLYPVGPDAMVAGYRALPWPGGPVPEVLESALHLAAVRSRGDVRQFRLRLLHRGLRLSAAPDAWGGNVFRLTESLLGQRAVRFDGDAPAAVATREAEGGIMCEMLFENYARAVLDVDEAAEAADRYSGAEVFRHPVSRVRLDESVCLSVAAVSRRRPLCDKIKFAETMRRAQPRDQGGPLAASWAAERGRGSCV